MCYRQRLESLSRQLYVTRVGRSVSCENTLFFANKSSRKQRLFRRAKTANESTFATYLTLAFQSSVRVSTPFTEPLVFHSLRRIPTYHRLSPFANACGASHGSALLFYGIPRNTKDHSARCFSRSCVHPSLHYEKLQSYVRQLGGWHKVDKVLLATDEAETVRIFSKVPRLVVRSMDRENLAYGRGWIETRSDLNVTEVTLSPICVYSHTAMS
jgi:hypothetical protein